MNAAAVAKEAETVTVTAKERKNESDHDLARDHARHLPHDQQLHGHAQALQQQSSAIKKKNRVDKAAHQVQTKLFSLCARFKRLEIEKELYSKIVATLPSSIMRFFRFSLASSSVHLS